MRAVLDRSLVDLLGEVRAQVVELLRGTTRTVADLADGLGLSEGAVRRHLQVLERDGLVSAQTVRREGPGRPSAHYALTDRAHRLFPDRSAELANELLDFITDSYGRQALRAFMRWRQGRKQARYASVSNSEHSTTQRAETLAGMLSVDGFPSRVVQAPAGATTLELRQEHCAIAEVAAEHPELCAYEAALFKDLLGTRVTRRQTIAGGAQACVCHITDADPHLDDTGVAHGHAR